MTFTYDALGRLRSKTPGAWAQPAITVGVTRVSVWDIMDLRARIDSFRQQEGLSTGGWTDPHIVAGSGVKVRALHFTEARDRIQGLWTARGLGTVPAFTGGALVGDGTRRIRASDLTDLRGWLGQYATAIGAGAAGTVSYTYDQGTNGIGRRTGMQDGLGSETTTYDAAGRVTQQTRTLDGASYTSASTYDALDRVKTSTLPGGPAGEAGEVLTSTYAADGRLSQLSSSLGETLVSGISYSTLGQPSGYTLGGGSSPTALVQQTLYGLEGVSTTNGLFGALQTHTWQQGTQPKLVDRTLQYDPAGNITSIADGVQGETLDYSYDHLDRLLSASAPVSESYTYSAIGNLTSKNGQWYSYQDAAHPQAVTDFSATHYGYDANGSMTSRTTGGVTQTIGYDPERHPVQLEQGGAVQWRAGYDGDGVRRKRLDASGTVHYLGSYERNVGTGAPGTEVVTTYYSALGRLVAFRTVSGGTSTLRWVGTDHLGSTIRVADSSFVALDQQRYLPFGGRRNNPPDGQNLGTDRLFTGQTEDASIGLYWYASRAYDPALGRFTCPDSIVPSPGDPQSLNRYSYVRNSPVNRVHPSGHSDWSKVIAELNEKGLVDAAGRPTDSKAAASMQSDEWLYDNSATVRYWKDEQRYQERIAQEAAAGAIAATELTAQEEDAEPILKMARRTEHSSGFRLGRSSDFVVVGYIGWLPGTPAGAGMIRMLDRYGRVYKPVEVEGALVNWGWGLGTGAPVMQEGWVLTFDYLDKDGLYSALSGITKTYDLGPLEVAVGASAVTAGAQLPGFGYAEVNWGIDPMGADENLRSLFPNLLGGWD